MRSRPAWAICPLMLAAAVCTGQITSTHSLEILLPPEVKAETFFARYTLSGQDVGGWIRAKPGVAAYSIDTMVHGRPAGGIKALLFAPGCALQTLDMSLLGEVHAEARFVCHPLATTAIVGKVTRLDRLYGKDLRVQARYVARWARGFLELGGDIVPVVTVAETSLDSARGSFRISVPDFAHDPLAGAADHDGEIQIWARETGNNDLTALLIPESPADIKTRMGGMKVLPQYPAEMVFSPCAKNAPPKHDREGFAIRPATHDACDQ